MRKIISRLAVVAGFLLAFSGCHLIRKSQAARAESPPPAKRTVASLSLSEGIPCNKGNYMDFILKDGIHNCNLRGGDFRARNFRVGANFEGANCRDADFQGAHVLSATFKSSDCREANFKGAHVQSANFKSSDCRETDFSGAHVQRSSFAGANCIDADFSGAYCVGADFSGASLICANFEGADCRGANFQGARIANAIMSDELREYAKSQGAILEDPRLIKVVVQGRVSPGCKRDEP